MDIRDSDVEQVPAENIHVARQVFRQVWAAAEEAAAAPDAWYAYGVASTCRWLACATVRPESGPWYVAPAPVSQRPGFALPERIEQECLEAEVLAIRRPPPEWLAQRPGWLDGVCATFAWAWRRTGHPPLPVSDRPSRPG